MANVLHEYNEFRYHLMEEEDEKKRLKMIRKELKEDLDKERYEHTMGVANTAVSLAMSVSYDYHKAFLAGLLHDCAKCIPNPEKITICENNGIEITEIEYENPSLLHSKLGALLAREKYGVSDEEILGSIIYHTTGKPDMNLLEKIIFVADYIEPGRDKQPNLTELRALAFHDLDQAVYRISGDTLEYLKKKELTLDPMTQKTYEYYQEWIKKR